MKPAGDTPGATLQIRRRGDRRGRGGRGLRWRGRNVALQESHAKAARQLPGRARGPWSSGMLLLDDGELPERRFTRPVEIVRADLCRPELLLVGFQQVL